MQPLRKQKNLSVNLRFKSPSLFLTDSSVVQPSYWTDCPDAARNVLFVAISDPSRVPILESKQAELDQLLEDPLGSGVFVINLRLEGQTFNFKVTHFGVFTNEEAEFTDLKCPVLWFPINLDDDEYQGEFTRLFHILVPHLRRPFISGEITITSPH